jgi:S-(hydroxymethyl)glutathione dehydrogenase/alcohol dehydrogenase
MKTKAAVLHEVGKDWDIVTLDLDEPRDGEVLVRFVAAGLCHSDEHVRIGDMAGRLPLVGGHEGAGVVEAVGPGVTRVKVGDHVVCSYIPSCGYCRWCSTGQQNLCDLGATILDGCMPDGTFRFHGNGEDYGALCMLGAFSQYSVLSETSCVVVDQDIDLHVAVLLSCGVPTGWGSAVYAAKVGPGDTVAIFGTGGIGMNAVQGARMAGASNIIAIDPVEMKRELATELGATHAVGSAAEAMALVQELTLGVGADSSIVTVDVVNPEVVQSAFDIIRKGGTEVITGLADLSAVTVTLPGTVMSLFQKTVKGSLFGYSNPMYDIKKLLGLYRNGSLKLDELVTARYSLDEVNQGYEDLHAGKNIRGILVHEH